MSPVIQADPKVGRNDPCPCGSGKKHKKCCGDPLQTKQGGIGPVEGPMLRAALAYAQRLGWPVLPVHWITEAGDCSCGGRPDCKPGKHPLTDHGFKEATRDEAQIRRWWTRWPAANIGIPTGQASGFDVLDVDPRHGGEESLAELEARHGKLPATVEALTGGGGRHILFRHQEGVSNRTGFLPGLDVRGEGGYVLVAPSITVKQYAWELSSRPGEVELAEWPAWALELVRKPTREEKAANLPAPREGPTTAYGRKALEDEAETIRLAPRGKQEFTINAGAFSLGTLIGAGGLDYQEALAALVDAAMQMDRTGTHPVTVAEVSKIIIDGLTDGMQHPRAVPALQQEGEGEKEEEEEEEKKKESPAAEIVKLVLQEAELFHDETRTPFARVQIKSHRENWRCGSEGFSLWLQRRVFEEKGRPLSSEAIAQALGVIKGKALFEGAQHPLNLRVAWHEGALWYDLSDPAWRAVRITPQGWTVCADPPILFTRYKHQAAQVDPVAGGDVRRLFEFVSVADEGARLLLLVWLVSCCIPGFPHPIPVLHGPQGSGKSSTFRTLRKLVDPSVLEVLTFPRDVTELVQKLSHHWAALFDNVTGLSGWQSDALCRAVTGEGFSKRALYTNDEDHIYHFQRCIGLNGINIVATRADLLDRAILISLERISPQQRKTEEEMEAAFAEARPQILGGIFDALVKAMRLKPAVELDRLPRMADFARWGCAIAQALGYPAEDFLTAYTGNLQQQNREVIEGHPVAAAVMGLMEDRDAWEGEPAALLKALEEVAERKRITTKGHGWPGAAHVLTRRLKEVKTNLQEAGVLIEGGHSGRRLVQIRKIASEASEASGALKDKGLQADATWTLLDASPNSVQMASSGSALKNQELDAMDAVDASSPTQMGAGLRHVEV